MKKCLQSFGKSFQLVIAMLMAAGLGAGCEGASTSSTNNGSKAAPVSISTVCEVARQPIGARVIVRGEYDGFSHAMPSKRVSILSEGVCSALGAGIVWAELVNQAEARKLDHAQPRNNRSSTPGTTITIEGEIEKVEEGRFSHLINANVRQPDDND